MCALSRVSVVGLATLGLLLGSLVGVARGVA